MKIYYHRMPTGRPTDYNKIILKRTKCYLSSCKDKKYRTRFVVNLPSVAGLAVYLKVARSTVYEWAAIHKQFSDILEQILAEQERRLISNGLSGDYNANIAKLVLGKHGYHEKIDTDLTSKGEKITGMSIITPDGKDSPSEAATETV